MTEVILLVALLPGQVFSVKLPVVTQRLIRPVRVNRLDALQRGTATPKAASTQRNVRVVHASHRVARPNKEISVVVNRLG